MLWTKFSRGSNAAVHHEDTSRDRGRVNASGYSTAGPSRGGRRIQIYLCGPDEVFPPTAEGDGDAAHGPEADTGSASVKSLVATAHAEVMAFLKVGIRGFASAMGSGRLGWWAWWFQWRRRSVASG